MVDQINHHLYRKRGFYYFSRRVPKALLDDYPKPRIVLALKTRHYRDALRQSQILSKRLDDQWFQIQLDAMGLGNVQARVFQPAKAAWRSLQLGYDLRWIRDRRKLRWCGR